MAEISIREKKTVPWGEGRIYGSRSWTWCLKREGWCWYLTWLDPSGKQFPVAFLLPSFHSSLPLLQSLKWLPRLLLQTVFFHMMDSLAVMVLGFQKGVPRHKWQSFLFVPDKNSSDWGQGRGARLSASPVALGEGLSDIRKGMGHCPRSKTRGYCVFVSVTPSLS